MTEKKRVNLYERLPEIYRIKDEELPEKYLYADQLAEAFQLRSYLAPVEEMFSAIHENIESLYHDFFIETCDDWVIPYIADLLGTTHLSGDAWTLRADVADTIALRRRKGTLGAIELLTYILTKWGVHSVELRENLLWNQHLNHQRPDEGGIPPYSLPKVKRQAAIRGGTMNLRDPSLLALLDKPFDPFAHVADVRPHKIGQVRYNLPNLAIYLWRLKAFRLDVTKPLMKKVTQPKEITDEGGAPFVVRVNVNPIPVNDASRPYVIVDNSDPEKDNSPEGQPVTLFNTNRYDFFSQKDKLNLPSLTPRISSVDQVPAPIPVERISDYEIAEDYDESLDSSAPQLFETFAEASFTAPHEYVSVKSYDETMVNLQTTLKISEVGFQLHIPNSKFPDEIWLHRNKGRFWKIRGENLCAWEKSLQPVLKDREIAIDPKRGRVVIGVVDVDRADALVNDLLLTLTYGAVGEVGAHPISYAALPKDFDVTKTPTVNHFEVNFREDADGLRKALEGIGARTAPTVIEITDSRTYSLDLNALPAKDKVDENGVVSLKLNAPLIIRAADNQRPIIELVRPLAFRPTNIVGADAAEQKKIDAAIEKLFVRLEGLFLARSENFAADQPLIARAALNKLEILNCTLDPGGFERFNGTRAPHFLSIKLSEPYGFEDADEEDKFKQTPEIEIQRSVCGAILLDAGYRLCLTDSIVDAGQGVGNSTDTFAVANATDAANDWAAQTIIRNVTILGRMRVASIEGSGGIFVHALETENQQVGCLKYCYFSGETADRLPQHYACVKGSSAVLLFTSETFGNAAYCQLSLQCDRKILEEGVKNDQMGAFNFLQEAHKWRNLQIRFREFMPVGIRPLLIPVT